MVGHSSEEPSPALQASVSSLVRTTARGKLLQGRTCREVDLWLSLPRLGHRGLVCPRVLTGRVAWGSGSQADLPTLALLCAGTRHSAGAHGTDGEGRPSGEAPCGSRWNPGPQESTQGHMLQEDVTAPPPSTEGRRKKAEFQVSSTLVL
jgi:hypothetical protein